MLETAQAMMRDQATASAAFGDAFSAPCAGKLGMGIFLVTDAMSFAGLLIAYAMLRVGDATWPIRGAKLDVPLTAASTFILICSSVTMVLASAAAKEKRQRALMAWLTATLAGGLLFLGGQAYEYSHLIDKGMGLASGNFAGTFYVITGFHACHVTAGVIYLLTLLSNAADGRYTKPGASASSIEIASLFWHFVDVVWIVVFAAVYLL